MLTFTYGLRASRTWVDPSFLRVMGGDVRTQFRDLVGLAVLEEAPDRYPRWVAEVDRAVLTRELDTSGAERAR
jgi:hypothetical protein